MWGVSIWHLAWKPTLISWLLAVPLGRFEDHELKYAMAVSFLILNHPLNWTYLIFIVCRTLLVKIGKLQSAPVCTQFPQLFFAHGQSEFHLSIFTLHKAQICNSDYLSFYKFPCFNTWILLLLCLTFFLILSCLLWVTMITTFQYLE